jgi:hypothetical protein
MQGRKCITVHGIKLTSASRLSVPEGIIRPLVLLLLKLLNYLAFKPLDFERTLYGYSRHASCALNKGNNKITELRTILQRESQNS